MQTRVYTLVLFHTGHWLTWNEHQYGGRLCRETEGNSVSSLFTGCHLLKPYLSEIQTHTGGERPLLCCCTAEWKDYKITPFPPNNHCLHLFNPTSSSYIAFNPLVLSLPFSISFAVFTFHCRSTMRQSHRSGFHCYFGIVFLFFFFFQEGSRCLSLHIFPSPSAQYAHHLPLPQPSIIVLHGLHSYYFSIWSSPCGAWEIELKPQVHSVWLQWTTFQHSALANSPLLWFHGPTHLIDFSLYIYIYIYIIFF